MDVHWFLPKHDTAPANRYASGTEPSELSPTTEPFCANPRPFTVDRRYLWLHCLYAISGINRGSVACRRDSHDDLVETVTTGWRRTESSVLPNASVECSCH